MLLCWQVVRASTLFGEPFADVKPQEIGAPMTIGSLNLSRPPPSGGAHGALGLPAARVGDADDFPLLEIERLAHASLRGLEDSLAVIDRWRQAGHGLEAIYVRGIAPCARLLGQWWLCDEANFAQVTIGSSNLQRVLHRLSHEFCAPGADRPVGLSVLLVTEPQSQHTMGAFMVGEFFRRRGWGVQLLTPQDGEDVLTHLRRDWFDAVGLSISTGRQLQALKDLLPRLRAESPNPGLRVFAGGPQASADPEALVAWGADLISGDALETVNALGHLTFARKS